MKTREQTRRRLIAHCRRYPSLQPQDLFKYLYQSAFGCEHLLASRENAVAYIKREYDTLSQQEYSVIEPLDGAYSRVSLSVLKNGMRAETLGCLFCRSARCEPDGKASLLEKIQVANEIAMEGLLPFSDSELANALEKWRAEGYSALHHSAVFREAYHPSYRVIANTYVDFLPLLAKIDSLLLKKSSAVIAIEGGSASGKTTLAKLLEDVYGCTVLHTDDFFLRPEQRTARRLAEVGGNMDRERFLQEILEPLHQGKTITYSPFDCSKQTLSQSVSVTPTPLTVIEGTYSMHTDLAPYYDFSVFLDIAPNYQKARILKRNTPRLAKRFFDEWIPLEKKYFEGMKAASRCDLVILITQDDLF